MQAKSQVYGPADLVPLLDIFAFLVRVHLPCDPKTGLRQRVPSKRILLAEDDPLVAHTLLMALAVDGHSVEVPIDGRQAPDVFTLGKHDLVITDFRMPSMDGMELAEAIKARSPTTPVILITGHIWYSERVGRFRVDVLLGKPCSVVELHDALRRLFPAA